MRTRRLVKNSPYGLGFTMRMDYTGPAAAIRVQALGLNVLVCESLSEGEAERRWRNTLKDLNETHDMCAGMIERGTPAPLVQSALSRLILANRIPGLNYIEATP